MFFKSIEFDKIEKVIIIEQTHNYRTGKIKGGLIFDESFFNPNVLFMDGDAEPDGCTYTFSVTYKDGKKEIVKAKSGTEKCDRLLQFALDDDSFNTKERNELVHTRPKKAPDLQKNQLPQGVYQIGKDIPAGTYDFHHVWGSGSVALYSAKETTLGNNQFFQWVGDQEDYEYLDCVNVRCEESWYLHVSENLIVEIKRSKRINIDL